MPQFKPKPVFERSAAADLAGKTLARIPTLFGRLIYLASLRDTNSGVYRHHGLASIHGREASRLAMSELHQEVFQDWLLLSLKEKWEDMAQYLSALEDPLPLVLEHWSKVRSYRAYIPASARESERELFFAEFEVLADTARCSNSGAGPRA